VESKDLKYVRGEISTREYWEHKLGSPAFSEQCAGCATCEERLRRALDTGFWRLDALDRSHPFWNRTNRLATESKLSAFAEHQIQMNEDVVDSAWLLIAISLRYGADHLKPEPWRILLSAGAFDADLAVCTAWNMSPYWDDQNVGRLAELAKSLKIERLVLEALTSLAQRGAEQASWAGEVRDAIAAT
jgi:hypothetical protein